MTHTTRKRRATKHSNKGDGRHDFVGPVRHSNWRAADYWNSREIGHVLCGGGWEGRGYDGQGIVLSYLDIARVESNSSAAQNHAARRV